MAKTKMFGNSALLIAALDETTPGNKFGVVTLCMPAGQDSMHRYTPPVSMKIWGREELEELRKAIDFALQTPSAPGPSE